MYRRGLLSGVVLLIAGCNGNGPEEPPEERAEIVDHELVRDHVGTDEETVAIEGTVRVNESGLQHVELRGRFVGADEEPLDTTFERLRELEVGTQPFEIHYPEIGPAAAAVAGYDVEITTIV